MNRIMGQIALALVLSVVPHAGFCSLLITGIIDGPRTGGNPKAIELFAASAIADLSTYSVVSFANGATTASSPFNLSGSVSAGAYLYVASEATEFTSFFGFAPSFTSSVLNVNGDDVVQLRLSGSPIDVFGVVGVDPPDNNTWNYLDSWFYRSNGTAATTTFQLSDWFFAGTGTSASNALDVLGSTGVNPVSGSLRMPIGTYVVPEPSTLGLAGVGVALAGLGAWKRRTAAAVLAG